MESAIKALQPVHIPKDSLGERVAQYDKVSHLDLHPVVEQGSTCKTNSQEACRRQRHPSGDSPKPSAEATWSATTPQLPHSCRP